MIKRLALGFVQRLARQFPVVLITGPRQCGKTTLAKECLGGEYFDLEKPSDHQVFAGDTELALRRSKRPLVLDEAQTMPSLFPVLRAVVDEQRRPGQFYLLGSVNPLLIEQIAESLAGRVGIVELTPFLYAEAKPAGLTLAEYWLRGGFPDACRAEDGAAWTLWQENYLRTFVERDVARQGVRVAPAQMRRFMTMMAHYHGNLLNASEIGRSLGVSYHTAQSYLEVLERHFLLRRLPPLEANLKKRLVKSPKVYLRDTGLLHHLLDIANERGLLASPKRGSSWEGLMIEQLLARTQWEQPGGQAWFYRTQTGTEVDLVLPRGRRRVGYEFKSALAVHAEDAAPLRTALADGVIDEGWVVYLGQRRFPIGNHIEAIGAEELLSAAASRP